METVTVEATRGYTLSEMEILVGSAIVLAVLVWTVFSVAGDLLTWMITRAIGPHPLNTWWATWLPVVDFTVEAFLMPLQITLIASAYAFSAARVGQRTAAAPAEQLDATPSRTVVVS